LTPFKQELSTIYCDQEKNQKLNNILRPRKKPKTQQYTGTQKTPETINNILGHNTGTVDNVLVPKITGTVDNVLET